MAKGYPPRSGSMTETLTFKRPVLTNDEITGSEVAFTCKGEVDFNAGREYQESAREIAETVAIFTIYARRDFDATYTIWHNGREYRILRLPPFTLGPRALKIDIAARNVK